MPVDYNPMTSTWNFTGQDVSKQYVSLKDQKKLFLAACPPKILQYLSDKKRMYFLLT